MSDNVVILEHHRLAREGGRAEAAGNCAKVRVIEVLLHRLTGQRPLPESLCHTWWRAAGHGLTAVAFALALALNLTACGGALAPVRVDESFTATEAEAVLAAVDAWCEATDGGVCPGTIVARRDGDGISLRPGVLAGRESGR